MSDILRQALAVAYQTAPHNRYSSLFPLGPLTLALRTELLEEFSQILCYSDYVSEGIYELYSGKIQAFWGGLSSPSSTVAKHGNIDNVKNWSSILWCGQAQRQMSCFCRSSVGRTFSPLSISGYHVDNLPMALQNLENLNNLFFILLISLFWLR